MFSFRPYILGFFLCLSVVGCNCDDTPPLQKTLCKDDSDCKEIDGQFCVLETGKCQDITTECSSDGECCPGQICSSQISECVDKFQQCVDDSSCTVRGQICKEIGSAPKGNGCTFAECTTTADCKDGLNCLNGSCVGEPPCNGGCTAGSVCTPVNNRCFTVKADADASCKQSCGEGAILVFKDPRNVFNRCNKSNNACECVSLPPVQANDMARHSDAVIASSSVLVSAYDADHGDLVLHTFDKATQKLVKTEWIDGVPTNGAIVGDSSGPRGGRAAPGIDVGQSTSIAYDSNSNTTHIAYYAVRDGSTLLGDLKYAGRSASGSFAAHLIDGKNGTTETGDAGRYTAIAVAPDGAPVIAYFQASGVGSDAYKTFLKVARAKSTTPKTAADWTISTVDSGIATAPPCSLTACTADEVCISQVGAPNGKCQKKAANQTDCKPSATDPQARTCKNTEVCGINASSKPQCFTSLRANTLADIPEGNGLMPSISYLGSVPVIVWYDRTNGVLKGVIAKSDSIASGVTIDAADIKILDDGKYPSSPNIAAHNVGAFPSVTTATIANVKRISVAYTDVTSRQLRALQAKDKWAEITPVPSRIVDAGEGEGGSGDTVAFVGADASIGVNAAGDTFIVYQDQTGTNLRMAKLLNNTTAWNISTVAKEGAGGFYATLMLDDGSGKYATHAVIKAASPSKSANRLELLQLP